MSAPAFDARPLTEPVDRAAVKEFTRARGLAPSAGTIVGLVVGGVAVAVVVLVMVPGVLFFLGSVMASALGEVAGALFTVVPLLVVLALVVLGVVAIVRRLAGGNERAYRLFRFAQANGMEYAGSIPSPVLPGMIFGVGGSRASADAVRGTRPRFVEFANYRYTTGSGKNQTTHHWGYVAIKLDAPLPHIVLDALGNNGLFGATNLPASFDRDQRLSLEGDFDRYFALSCPAGYERDALYLFTPDIMARFIDNAAALDVEIVDDWLFLYAKRDFATLDPAMWAWLFSVVAALLDKLAQWGRWRDERLTTDAAATSAPLPSSLSGAGETASGAVPGQPAPPLPFQPPAGFATPPAGVAAPGRRLRRRVPWAAIVIGGIVVIFWLLLNTGVLGMLGSLFVG